MSPRGILGPLLVLGLAIATVGCESTSSTSTGPSPVKCQVSLEAPPDSIESAGGKGAITVSAQPECGWTASSDATWLTGLTPSSGQGAGRVEFQAAPNPAGTTRQGHIEVNGQQIQVQQRPAACRFEVSPAAPTIDAGGGTVTIAVTTLTGCGWQVRADVGWIATTSSGGTGSGSVSLRVAPNGGEARSVALLIAGQTVTLTQSSTTPISPNCVFSLERASEAVSAAGGSVTVAVSGAAGCSRTATSQVPWIAVVAGASGTGTGAVTFNVALNSGAARTGTLTIAGRVFTVTQAAAGAGPGPGPGSDCSYSITPDNQAIGAAGGDGFAVAVWTAAGCAWTARSNAGWITLIAGANGNGAGVVTFGIAANAASARTGTLTIAGRTFTVDQASASCTYSINPTEQEINEKGGSLTVMVSAGAGCGWTATSNESWITITEGATGSGNGTVRFNVESTGGRKRTGTLTIAGRTFKVEQDKKND